MTILRVEPLTLSASDLGPENPLPEFRRERNNDKIRVSPDLPAEDRRRIGWEIGHRVLPYRLQDGYGRELRPRTFQSIVLENENLRAVFLPELGGRLVSLFHKPDGRELLEPVRRFQPANLALRNAWFSGGIEWNAGQFGHHYLTCSPVFAARVEGPKGAPALRLYQWERAKRFPWQIDFHLPPGSHFLFARVRLSNPHDEEIPMYWWTNLAVPETADSRVLAPAETAIAHSPDKGLELQDLTDPVADAPYPARAIQAREFFFRVPEEHRKWIAALDGSGRGLVQCSTARLVGRKAFYWGMNPGGRRWQELLGGAGSAYFEIQAGLARTQLESVPMPARSEWSWTEAFGPGDCAEAAGHPGWEKSWRAAEAALDARLPSETLARIDRELAVASTRPPGELLERGDGWGALERRRLAASKQPDRIPPELVFPAETLGAEQAPWLALLERGALPERGPEAGNVAFMVQPEWRELLEQALAAGRGDHWLSWYHLGNMRGEEFELPGAREAWRKSVERRPTAWALRNLAVLEARAGRPAEARLLWAEAWEAGPQPMALAVEYGRALAEAADWSALGRFVAALPAQTRGHERLQVLAARAALEAGDYATVERVLAREFTFVREGETTLTDLWFALHERRTAAAEGAAIDDAFRRRIRERFPPPKHLDFRMSAKAL